MYTELTLTLALSVAASVTCSFPLMLKRQEEPPTVYFRAAVKGPVCLWCQAGNQKHGYYSLSAHLCEPSVTSNSPRISILTPAVVWL